MRGIQEELAAFFLDHVIAENGEYYVDPVFLQYNPLIIYELRVHMVFSGFIDDVVKKKSR